MANPFHYPKTKHTRTRTPPAYSNYRQYKPDLRIEFSAQCVYCRSLDRIKGYETFGVDHYRTKRDFPHLTTEYLNLFYACNRCNSFKGSYWPSSQELKDGIFVPNPCEHVMFDHLRYNGGWVDPHSDAGAETILHLDLNDPDCVSFRNSFITVLAATNSQKEQAELILKDAEALLLSAKTQSAKTAASEMRDEAKKNLEILEDALRNILG